MKKDKRNHREWQRSGEFNDHHIVNKCNGGKRTPKNILRMDIARHNAWHFLFGNMSFKEVANLLKRCQRMKDFQN